jgi:hypothetical protein
VFDLIVHAYPEIADRVAVTEDYWRNEDGSHNVFALVAIVLLPYVQGHFVSAEEHYRLASLVNEMIASPDEHARAVADTGIIEGFMEELAAAPLAVASLSTDARRAYDMIRAWSR